MNNKTKIQILSTTSKILNIAAEILCYLTLPVIIIISFPFMILSMLNDKIIKMIESREENEKEI
jgi:hypothetical protein